MADTSTNHFSPQSKTQAAAILRLLIQARGDWVALPEILKCAAQYSARICELRKQGLNIQNKTERQSDGARHSWFRLLPGDTRFDPVPPKSASVEQPPWEERKRITGLPLFDLVSK